MQNLRRMPTSCQISGLQLAWHGHGEPMSPQITSRKSVVDQVEVRDVEQDGEEPK